MSQYLLDKDFEKGSKKLRKYEKRKIRKENKELKSKAINC
jgi:hypothetical protein